jgi:hypothetical protein
MRKKDFLQEDVLSLNQLNEVKGGNIARDVYNAYTTAKGTPVSSSTSIAKPTSVRGDELVARTISTVSTIGTQLGASQQDIYIATSVSLAALPYLRTL